MSGIQYNHSTTESFTHPTRKCCYIKGSDLPCAVCWLTIWLWYLPYEPFGGGEILCCLDSILILAILYISPMTKPWNEKRQVDLHEMGCIQISLKAFSGMLSWAFNILCKFLYHQSSSLNSIWVCNYPDYPLVFAHERVFMHTAGHCSFKINLKTQCTLKGLYTGSVLFLIIFLRHS